jgi:hypothetical protein
MKKALAIGILAVAALSAACARDHHESGGPTVERDFQVGGFELIEVAGHYDVDVRTGSAPSVHASGPEKELERLVVEVKGNRLLIHARKNGGFNMGWSSKEPTRISVTVPKLSGAAIAGSGGITVDKVASESFKGEIAGSGDLSVGAIEANLVELSIAGSGNISAAGKAKTAQYNIAGSGNIDADGLVSEAADVSVAGSGNVTANATTTANVNSMGSGDVALSGGAKCTVSKHGSGDVRCS